MSGSENREGLGFTPSIQAMAQKLIKFGFCFSSAIVMYCGQDIRCKYEKWINANYADWMASWCVYEMSKSKS